MRIAQGKEERCRGWATNGVEGMGYRTGKETCLLYDLTHEESKKGTAEEIGHRNKTKLQRKKGDTSKIKVEEPTKSFLLGLFLFPPTPDSSSSFSALFRDSTSFSHAPTSK